MTRWDDIVNKVYADKRLSKEEALFLLTEAPLLELGALAHQVRFKKNPEPQVTFVIDTNPNYTNVCVTNCLFCAFYRPPGSPEGYTLSVEEFIEKIESAVKQGATTVLLQGGHNPDIPFEYYLELIRETRRRFPHVTPHFFTASEIQFMARTFNMTVREVLEKLSEAGQYTLPGGGAEILSEPVRQRIAPKKGSVASWLEVHREAHRLGWRSTATMMYGHVETPEDIVQHLDAIRTLQDETGGFTAFVPWSCKPDNSYITKWVHERASGLKYLRVIATARLFLDNFDHIQASWFSEGKKIGQVALYYGADDFGGTLFEEHVHESTGFVNQTTTEEIIDLIRFAGFVPVQRTTLYEKVKIYAPPSHPEVNESNVQPERLFT